jgi:hypothetical protein
MRRPALLLLGLGLVLGCGDDDGTGPDDDPLTLLGNWTWEMSAGNNTEGIACTASGQASFSTNGSNVTGTLDDVESGCLGDEAPGFAPAGFTGTVNNRNVTLNDGICLYSGSADEPGDDSPVSGNVTCTFDGTPDLVLTGTWSMEP